MFCCCWDVSGASFWLMCCPFFIIYIAPSAAMQGKKMFYKSEELAEFWVKKLLDAGDDKKRRRLTVA